MNIAHTPRISCKATALLRFCELNPKYHKPMHFIANWLINVRLS